MLKWNEPAGTPPEWLDVSLESTEHDTKLTTNQFVIACVKALQKLGCSLDQAASVTANTIVETAWGKSYRANNLGGVKISKGYCEAYKKQYGKGPRWWRAPGNKLAGDEPWCYYRAYDSLEDFFRDWLAHFVPNPGLPAPWPAYKACGEAFWQAKEWFPELIKAGYKGAITKALPWKAIYEHKSITQSVKTRWAQYRLGVEPDGKWGPVSQAACKALQNREKLLATGMLDEITLQLLADEREAMLPPPPPDMAA